MLNTSGMFPEGKEREVDLIWISYLAEKNLLRVNKINSRKIC